MSQRMLRVSELMRREIGQDIQREFEFPNALVSIHGVEVTSDLREAQVFVGVIGSAEASREAVEKLNNFRGAIQNRIARRVVLKFTPKLHFRLDDSVARGVEVIDLLDQIEIPEDIEPAEDLPSTKPTDSDERDH
jgi:ribosome-binding factor A